MKIAVVIVTYRSAETIEACIRSLDMSTVNTSIIVVDNMSDDETCRLVEERFPHVRLVRCDDNLGFAEGCNVGIKIAIAEGATEILLLNPDTTVSASCAEILSDAVDSNDEIAAASPLILQSDARTIWYAGAQFDPVRLHFHHERLGATSTRTQHGIIPTGRPNGCAMMIRSDKFTAVGMLDPTYFLYWEECDWTARARAAGFSMAFVPDALVIHEAGHSTGGTYSNVTTYYYTRNELRIFRELGGKSRLRAIRTLIPRSLWRATRATLTAGPRSGYRVAKATALAYHDFWRGRFGRRDEIK